jgi:hypothetical protein
MTSRPTFEVSRLREIGWSKWDPIGVGGLDDDWPADEYDAYLLQAAGQIWNGHSADEVADYLIQIETEHMGLDAVPGIRSRALDVANSIRAYVETLRT